jgi:hypothetical protein
MNYKFLILLLFGFLSFEILSAQDKLSNDYVFVNSIYKNHVKSNIAYYYLYYIPIILHFTESLRDTLSKYLSDTDILLIKKQMEIPDTSFTWNQDYLNTCKVIQDGKVKELQSKNTFLSVKMIEGRTEKPVKNLFNKDSIPLEERQFYYFSKPIWNIDKSVVIFGIQFDEGNHGGNGICIYRKENKDWRLLTEMLGLAWMKI